MKKALWTFLFIACNSRASDQCTTAQVLTQIRPGAAWSMQGDSIRKLNWLDTKQRKPSAAEVEKAIKNCIEETRTREARKAQARIDVKNPTIPVEKKLDQLILLLDLDK